MARDRIYSSLSTSMSSFTSTTVSSENRDSFSSPLLSSPLLHPYRRAGSCFNVQDSDRRDHFWDCHSRQEYPISRIYRPLPSLTTNFPESTIWGDAYSPSPFSSASKASYLYPQGDSAIADDYEEYDLESMNIHIHETYFATSAERGRWLSSPIVSRTRTPAPPPMRGHSSPIRKQSNTPSREERLHRRTDICPLDQEIFIQLSQDRDDDMRSSSPLPPSSPLTSPLSTLSFLGDDCEDEGTVDPCSDSFPSRTPELSSTTCTSPVESARLPTPHESSSIISTPSPTGSPFHSPSSAVSRHPSPCHNHSPDLIDTHIHTPSHPAFEPDGILSPLSQFELDLPEAEPSNLPLSDMENKPYQRMASPGVAIETVQSHVGLQFLSINPNHKPLDVTLDVVGEANSGKRAGKRRDNTTSDVGGRPRKKRTSIRCRSPPEANKRKGAENHAFSHSEPPSKKSKRSRCEDDLEARGSGSRPRRGGVSKAKRLWRSPLHSNNSETACTHDWKISVTVDAPEAEFHASLTGMLVEAFATSRATSMDSAALYPVLSQAHPQLTTERSKEELLMDITAVLEAGRVRCGMFEKVDSSRERSRHKGLESRWFYVPERDEDEERASLISAIMPRQKRSETKKYKQYYYKPLGKVSRWDE